MEIEPKSSSSSLTRIKIRVILDEGGISLKIYKAREMKTLLEEDGWYLVETRGSHHHYKHPTKKGKVTIPVHGGDLNPLTAQNILKQAGLR
jgi:predicted RNA binding protein YcfA (HicA-like mRNA interferase family)